MAHQCRSSSAGSTRPVRRGSYISALPDFTNPRQTLFNSSNSSCSSSGSGTIGGTSGRGMSPGGTTVSTAVGASLGVPYAAGLFGLVAALILL
ncbi:hypothetical protein P8C59_005775 [Phyllachora maydis]|uniref:Uncharacterized protein n=1 Tax=Phyllachora maydis TaxID=1825666 RepID=A0AAD9I537_9PEZI|nr:hypothetical protein P8C59_005775 [Phyllachora maydis]